MDCWSIGDEAEEAFRSKFLMTCVFCWIITQLYILIRRTNEITNVARNIATLKASAFAFPPAGRASTSNGVAIRQKRPAFGRPFPRGRSGMLHRLEPSVAAGSADA